MKTRVLLFGLMLGSMNLAMGQFYTITPNDTVVTIVPQNQLTIVDIYQHNATVDTIQLSWTKVYEDIPAGWDYSLCDLGTCYPGFPLGGTMALIAPPDSGFLGVNVDPFSLTGTLTVRFYVYETSAPTQGDTLTWILTAETTGMEDEIANSFKIYPNPTTDVIYISYEAFPAIVTVYDMNGKVMMNQNVSTNNEAIDVSSLPKGNYIMTVGNNNLIRKGFIKQ